MVLALSPVSLPSPLRHPTESGSPSLRGVVVSSSPFGQSPASGSSKPASLKVPFVSAVATVNNELRVALVGNEIPVRGLINVTAVVAATVVVAEEELAGVVEELEPPPEELEPPPDELEPPPDEFDPPPSEDAASRNRTWYLPPPEIFAPYALLFCVDGVSEEPETLVFTVGKVERLAEPVYRYTVPVPAFTILFMADVVV